MCDVQSSLLGTVDDVACLIIPEELHSAAVGFFETAKAENTGPAYEWPFIDPYWSRKKVEKAVKDECTTLFRTIRAYTLSMDVVTSKP